MNFLSHYYFDQDINNCYFILGTVLPDLLKNADKTIVLHPEKLQHNDSAVNNIIKGWNKHLEVDRYFHSSDFFKIHSHQLKKALLPAIVGSPVKPFFLGHIAVELILDNLLITTQKVIVNEFYQHLHGCRQSKIQDFFDAAELADTTKFFRFFEKFKADRYLHTYAEIHQIVYALKRICARVWQNPFTEQHEKQMETIIADYRALLQPQYMLIFNEIAVKLDEAG